jgi:hypothetical protein
VGGCFGGRRPVGSSRSRWEGAVWKAAARKRGREGHGPKMGRIVIEGGHDIKTQYILILSSIFIRASNFINVMPLVLGKQSFCSH